MSVTGGDPNLVVGPNVQLPPDIADFTGRGELVADVAARLVGGTVVVLHGMPGVGKSALAVRAAHAVAERFPDGQLFAELDADARPVAVLGRFLRALAASLPPPEERGAAFRSAVAGKRVLVVLDGARDASQVRALLPESGTCAVLVTSRSPLGTLADVDRQRVEPLNDAEGLALLTRLAGAERAQHDPQAAETLVRLCEELPLAIRIVAGRLALEPNISLTALTARMEDRRSRLSELEVEDLSVRAALMTSYEDLVADHARVFRYLSAVPGSDVSLRSATAVCRRNDAELAAILGELERRSLIQARERDRFGFHELVRAFALERLAAEDPPGTDLEVAGRVIETLLDDVERQEWLPATGPLDDAQAATLEWYRDELSTLGDVIDAGDRYTAADERGSGPGAACVGLQLLARSDLPGAVAAFSRADERGSGTGAYRLGMVLKGTGDLDAAVGAFRRADERGHPGGTFQLGTWFHHQGDRERAGDAMRRADAQGHADAASEYGRFLAWQGDDGGAMAAFKRADRRGSAEGAFQLALLLVEQNGDRDEIESALRRADARGSAGAALNLGTIEADRDDFDAAEVAFARAARRGHPDGRRNLEILRLRRPD